MDREDENFYERSDWNTYNEPPELDRCVYCSEELEILNTVYYAIDDDYNVKMLAINPLPHEKIVVPEGYKKRMELVCDDCLKEEYPDA